MACLSGGFSSEINPITAEGPQEIGGALPRGDEQRTERRNIPLVHNDVAEWTGPAVYFARVSASQGDAVGKSRNPGRGPVPWPKSRPR